MTKTKNDNGKRNLMIAGTAIAGLIVALFVFMLNCGKSELDSKVSSPVYHAEQKDLRDDIEKVEIKVDKVQEDVHNIEIEQAKQGQTLKAIAHKLRVKSVDE